MAIVFTSIASWKALIYVYKWFEGGVLIRGMSSIRVSNYAVMALIPDCVDMMVWGC